MSHQGECYIILGMHRSGTSALAGTLGESGVYLGQVLNQSIKRNPKGLQEPPAVLYMQEDLLKANGGRWDSPPETVTWFPMHAAVRDLFIESRRGVGAWAFKDPRTLITLDGWLTVLDEPRLVGIFRHPMAVARSLESRNGFPIEKGLELWRIYNSRLLAWRKRRAFPIVQCIPSDVLMYQSLERLLAELGLARTEPLEFFDTSLQTVGHSEGDQLPQAVQDIWEALVGYAI